MNNINVFRLFNKSNLKLVVIDLLAGAFASLCILPLLIRIRFIQQILRIQTYNIFLYIFLFFLFVFLTASNHVSFFWKRIKNNYKLKSPPYTLFEHLLFFIISFSVITILLFKRLILFTYISNEFLYASALTFTLILLYFLIPLFYDFSGVDIEQKKENGKETKAIPYFTDEPINSIDQDLLGRADFIRNIVLQITKIPFPDSYVIGLYAKWGEGKTSILKLVKNEFSKDKNEGIIFIEFDPWIFKNDEAILRSFYDSIFREINRRYFLPDLKRLIKKYTSLLNYEVKPLPLKLDLTMMDDSIEEIKAKVDRCIKKLGRKIVISIDDIDRLMPHEILLIFKVIKISANFKNTVFILSFDLDKVIDVMKKEPEINHEYFDKIIQQPIYIPEIEQSDLDNSLSIALEKLFEEVDIKEDRLEKFINDFKLDYLTNINRLFKTLRHTKRYLNGIRSSLPPVKNEVNLYDFFMLEVIKAFFPNIYNDIYESWWFYVNSISEKDPFFLSPLAHLDEEKAKEKIKEHWGIITRDIEDDYRREILETIICRLFRKLDHALERNLYNSDNPDLDQKIDSFTFLKYFINRIPRKEISDDVVIMNIEAWNTLEEEQQKKDIEKVLIDFQDKGDLIKFFNKLMIFSDKIKKKTAETLIRGIYKRANMFSQTLKRGLEESELDRAELLLLKILNDRIEPSKIQTFLEEIIKYSRTIFLPVRLILDCDKARISGFYKLRENIDIEKLRDLMLNRLKVYFIDEKRDVFKEELAWSEILCIWSSNWYRYDGVHKKEVNDYIFSLISKNPKHSGLLLNEWSRGPEHKSMNLDEMAKYFDLNRLYEKIMKDKNNSYSNDKEKSAVSLFIKVYKARIKKSNKK